MCAGLCHDPLTSQGGHSGTASDYLDVARNRSERQVNLYSVACQIPAAKTRWGRPQLGGALVNEQISMWLERRIWPAPNGLTLNRPPTAGSSGTQSNRRAFSSSLRNGADVRDPGGSYQVKPPRCSHRGRSVHDLRHPGAAIPAGPTGIILAHDWGRGERRPSDFLTRRPLAEVPSELTRLDSSV
jgi:hypothetical protein